MSTNTTTPEEKKTEVKTEVKTEKKVEAKAETKTVSKSPIESTIGTENTSEIRYLSPLDIEIEKKPQFCRFKKGGFKYVDYKNTDFLLQFVNEQGKILPRRVTGTSLKFQRRVSQAIKRARHLSMLPYVTDLLK